MRLVSGIVASSPPAGAPNLDLADSEARLIAALDAASADNERPPGG
jgi:hypothetical protein